MREAEKLALKEIERVVRMLDSIISGSIELSYDLVNDCASLLATAAWRLQEDP